MKTITFYSYKGGVGRSLAVSDMATRLSELGQRVCVIDFDLDAPGLRFKFKNYFFPEITKGIVDYIYEFSSNRVVGNIADYAVEASPINSFFEPIVFISAGDIYGDNYWKKLSMIKWYDLFYSDNPLGIDFFLDLKAQIEEKYQPDFLLIDSRTGITDISGVTLRLLADQVVVLGINNEENLFGCQRIIKSLLNPESNLLGKALPVNFVLTRVGYFKKDKDKEIIDREKEAIIIEQIRTRFKQYLKVDDFDISIIHTDWSLEQEETQLRESLYENQPGSVSKDYLQLFEKLTTGLLNLDEKFLNFKKAEIEYVKSFSEGDPQKKLSLIDKAIAIDSTKHEYYLERGVIYFSMGNYEKSLEDHLIASKLNANDPVVNNNLGIIYSRLKNKSLALEYFDKAGDYSEAIYHKGTIYRRANRLNEAIAAYTQFLSMNPAMDKVLNSRADAYRASGQFKEAMADITQAIELSSDNPIYFATLAEIYHGMGKIDEFYLNLSIALSKGLQGNNLNYAFDVYEKYFNDERFLALISKYKINLNELYNDTVD